MRAVILFALLLSAPLIAGDEQFDLQTRIEVDVFSKAGGSWHARKGTVHKFDDARFVACIEYKDKLVMDCILIDDADSVLLLPVKLLEDKV